MMRSIFKLHSLLFTSYFYHIFQKQSFGLITMLEDGVSNTVMNTGMVKILTGMYHHPIYMNCLSCLIDLLIIILSIQDC